MKRVYFNEYNVRMGKMCYLPLVSGLLQSYAQTSEVVKANYKFMRPIFSIDSFDNVMAQYTEEPDVAAFSVAMWNEQLNLKVAAEVRRRWPNCLIVFGGTDVPHHPTAYMERHSFVDVAVRAEGEETFLDILLRHLEGGDFDDIPNVTYRRKSDGAIIEVEKERAFQRDLDSYPSPYLEGVFDDLLTLRSDTLDFQAIIETNRGCPFQCTFCYWGRGGLSRKYRYHNMDRVFAEIDWAGRNKILYVFNADSNFGMHKRDPEIADFIVATKEKYGYPDKFRTCFGKNTDETIFNIGLLFHSKGLEKGITLARQSNDKTTLKNIKRGNIKMSTYTNLQIRFNDANVPIYSELILGLPGETVETWKNGIDELLESGLKNQLFIYLCQVFNNTELGDPAYQEKFGIKTQRIELNEIHGSIRDASWVKEYEHIITESYSMTQTDWRRMVRLSWITMVLHSMKLGFYAMIWLRDRYGVKASDLIQFISDREAASLKGSIMGDELDKYDGLIDKMLNEGAGRGLALREYGDIYWDVEEATFLRAAEELDRFYSEFTTLLVEFLDGRNVPFDRADLEEMIRYQQARIPARVPTTITEHHFRHNLPEFFDRRFSTQPIPLLAVQQSMTTHPIDFEGDKKRFARETILWGRKSGTMLVSTAFEPHPEAEVLQQAIG
ncbi:hypothetical protein [Ferrovibrio sp.]|uniref:B12-binding domain-containing radical SAM protein n=1 Tax=Ferrovibrio sp. TaxID=1917215 RepID=UPI001B5C00CF|nr:hypothetical protein [Ferrovibrio sp.]MBP7063434.1 hypothetical protein [Ferrovibrio sp.]